VLLRDIHEVKERVRAGACRGGQNCTCGQCQQPVGEGYYLAENGSQPSSENTDNTITQSGAEQSANGEQVKAVADHVVYGSRATRQRLAQQGSFTAPAGETASQQTAESQKLTTRR
jgi:hypothetical protein